MSISLQWIFNILFPHEAFRAWQNVIFNASLNSQIENSVEAVIRYDNGT